MELLDYICIFVLTNFIPFHAFSTSHEKIQSSHDLSDTNRYEWVHHEALCYDNQMQDIIPLPVVKEGGTCRKLSDWSRAEKIYGQIIGGDFPSSGDRGYVAFKRLLEVARNPNREFKLNLKYNFYTHNDTHYKQCLERASLFNKKFQDPYSVADISRLILRMNSDIIFIGEEHWTNSLNIYPELLERFKSDIPELNCLFLEVAPESYNEAIMEAEKAKVVNRSNPYSNFQQILIAARKNQIDHIIPMDLNKLQSIKLENTGEQYLLRNEGMVKVIQSKFKNKTCKKSIVIVGQAHLSKNSEAMKDFPNYKTIIELLPKGKYKYTNILLLDLGGLVLTPQVPYGIGFSSAFVWPTCLFVPNLPSKVGGFSNKNINKSFEVFGGYGGGGHWADFDFTIYYPPSLTSHNKEKVILNPIEQIK